MIKKIAIACDHGGYMLKAPVVEFLKAGGYEIVDFGCDSSASVDYPDHAIPAARAVAAGECDIGILICGTGIGMSLCANKIKGIRAACCSERYSAKMTRMHNNANVLCFGARVVGEGIALDMIKVFLETEYEGGRHDSRVAKIMQLEKE